MKDEYVEEMSEEQKRIRHLECELDNLEMMYKATKGVRDELEKENEELRRRNRILENDLRVVQEDIEHLRLAVGKEVKKFIHDYPYSALVCYANSELVKENEELKYQLKMSEQVASDNPNLFIENCNLKNENAELKLQLEKTKEDCIKEVIDAMGIVSQRNLKIEQLEKENEELNAKLDFFLTETVEGKEYRPKEELDCLQKENAELKTKLNAWEYGSPILELEKEITLQSS